jgi:malate dehydrogenase (oxaloacetate-decarboxylating)
MGKDYGKLALKVHQEHQGKIAVRSKVPLRTREDLSLAYTPGVAEPCLRIAANPEDIYKYTSKRNLVAVVSDGSAVLGLGNIGGGASMPVMEGKCVLFKAFGGVDAFPIGLNTQNPEEVIATVKNIAPAFGGINLEDIKAPECFIIEKRLKEETDIPIFHDDQHGTAIVTLAGLLNGLKLAGKELSQVKIVINGAGAAGTAIAKLLLNSGARHIVTLDREGAIYQGRPKLNWAKEELASFTNHDRETGPLDRVICGADVFIGVSSPHVLSGEMVRTMNSQPIIFAQANPVPEIEPSLAKAAGAFIIATGRSDYPNQINNVLAFPGIFRGALDVRAREINEAMKIAAAVALAEMVDPKRLNPEFVIPEALDFTVGSQVAAAVAAAAVSSGVAAAPRTYEAELEQARALIQKSQGDPG